MGIDETSALPRYLEHYKQSPIYICFIRFDTENSLLSQIYTYPPAFFV